MNAEIKGETYTFRKLAKDQVLITVAATNANAGMIVFPGTLNPVVYGHTQDWSAEEKNQAIEAARKARP